jgi:3-hydroxyacyl-CoA dehydrogenase
MDTAMRLGFNWPLGPLEFADLIGPGDAVVGLENLQSRHGDAYTPAPLLRSAAERDLALRDAA